MKAFSVAARRAGVRPSVFSLVLASCLLAAAPVRAAEPLPAAPGPEAPVAEPAADFTSGWYLRGDVTGTFFSDPETEYTVPGAPPIGPIDYRNEKINKAFGAGLGLGFRYGFARFDVTYDMRGKTRYTGFVPPFNDWNHPGPFPVPARRETFSLETRTFLANGYFDLGTWGRITPYVGVGLGVSNLKASNYVSRPLPLTAQLGGVTINSPLGSADKWNFTWALMMGAAFKITDHLKLDVGYRFIDMGKFAFNHVDNAGNTTASIRMKNIQAHEVRVGLRYELHSGIMFNGSVEKPRY